ncbi:MAG: CRISPR-associated endonuclease Cas3'' [Burkholderiales bacterium]|nr:CRISPR-associated endonuclease Cas3'' [Burkholderiales bacterium]OJX07739.1 MAG: CRISPR-associated endonuclease Cas3'' [Burkholderiales bacterium 70-64]
MNHPNLETIYRCAYRREDVQPYPFQRAIAENADVDILVAPTGLGKTAAIVLSWIWQLLANAPATPRRLVWCLPMRVLAEQIAREAQAWIDNLDDLFERSGCPKPSVHLLMGGAVDEDWRLRPENPAILVGTQDMLLSRALMRGYGMSRFGWPIDYGLLHNDALWVYDEVQLMGAGLATSAQLEAFRRRTGWRHERAARSLWVSATLDPRWLDTVEFRSEIPEPVVLRWDDGNPPESPSLRARLDAVKRVKRAETTVTADSLKKPQAHAIALAREVASLHRKETTTLVIVNTVRRAVALYAALADVLEASTARLLIHSRYRPPERRALEEHLRAGAGDDRVVVATQAIEAGVDMTSAVLFTELAPWSSMVQRFGRCNRAGELNDTGGAEVRWIDIETEADRASARPYEVEDLKAARDILATLDEVSPRKLPPPSRPRRPAQVIRPKDFEELFDTDADLSGYDLDVSPYIRDSNDLSVSLFWRTVGNAERVSAKRPLRDELCSAPLNDDLRAWLLPKEGNAPAYVEDPLAHDGDPWVRLDKSSHRRLRPGLTVLLDVRMGGYDLELGFVGASATAPVKPIAESPTTAAAAGNDTDVGATTDDDPQSFGSAAALLLERHLDDVAKCAREIAQALGLPPAQVEALCRAGAWHDLGKAFPPFQILLGGSPPAPLLAKSAEIQASKERRQRAEATGLRRYFRHELASALAFLQQHHGEPNADLIAFLIAAHHGKIRMGLRALSQERADKPTLRIARGVQDGDRLPELRCGDELSNAVELDLGPMEMGEDEQGRPSWSARMRTLLAEHGPFRLAYLEALIRMADWRASASAKDEST